MNSKSTLQAVSKIDTGVRGSYVKEKESNKDITHHLSMKTPEIAKRQVPTIATEMVTIESPAKTPNLLGGDLNFNSGLKSRLI